MARAAASTTSPTRAQGQALSPQDLLGWATFALMALALYGALIYAPTERVQGFAQRIFYVHVPLAWVAYLAFFVVFLGSSLYLWRRTPRWDILARCSAEVGVVFTTLVIISGTLWARPIWGTWWTWDARLTTTLVLWFIYVAYLMLRASAEGPRAARYAAVLGIVGFLDVPLIHQSVVWWRTLHPEATVLRAEGPALPPEMLLVLGVSLVAFTLFYVYLLLLRLRWEWAREDLEELKSRLAL